MENEVRHQAMGQVVERPRVDEGVEVRGRLEPGDAVSGRGQIDDDLLLRMVLGDEADALEGRELAHGRRGADEAADREVRQHGAPDDRRTEERAEGADDGLVRVERDVLDVLVGPAEDPRAALAVAELDEHRAAVPLRGLDRERRRDGGLADAALAGDEDDPREPPTAAAAARRRTGAPFVGRGHSSDEAHQPEPHERARFGRSFGEERHRVARRPPGPRRAPDPLLDDARRGDDRVRGFHEAPPGVRTSGPRPASRERRIAMGAESTGRTSMRQV